MKSSSLTIAALVVTGWILVMTGASVSASDETEFFTEYVEPLLKQRCYECHSHDAGEASGGLVLDSKAGWETGGDTGPAVVANSLSDSLLWRAVSGAEPGLEMPPEGRLREDELNTLRRWIETGAVDSRTEAPTVTKKTVDIEAGKQWWAFQPLRSSLEQRQEAALDPQRIDAFINQRLAEAGIEPVGLATQEVLLRRLSYDLTGLPPAAVLSGEVSYDNDVEFSSIVDRMLASQQFGEKWGRHWLDVARYADSNGSSFNVPFHNAWRYRNWVVSALNQGMPIDEFIRKQIAGDLLPAVTAAERDENLIATGYLLLGSKVLGTFDKQQLHLDVIDEQLDTIGKSLMGMTLGCARCHDHKFDPIPQRDYYALAGILASTSTLNDRIGGPKEDESDWQRRGLGPGGDEQLKTFLNKHRYAWVKAKSKRFQALQALQALERQAAESGDDLAEEFAKARDTFAKADDTLKEYVSQIPPHAMAVCDAETICDLEVRIRGVAASKGEMVPRGFLQVLEIDGIPTIPEEESGRLQLAQWLTSTENPLVARVFVNRVWKHMFREGLVRTVDNFGTTGSLPTHPELLDYLADGFIRSGWDLKSLIRTITMTRAYRRRVASCSDLDPTNEKLGHQSRRRLEAEEIRDTLLFISGRLSFESGGGMLEELPIGDVSNLGQYLSIQDQRRTIYQPVIRTLESDLHQLFDAASNAMVTGARPRTIVAPQALYFLNSQQVSQAAGLVANDLIQPHLVESLESLPAPDYEDKLLSIIESLFTKVICRRPTTEEIEVMSGYLRAQADGEAGLTKHDLMKGCQVLISSTQFQFLD